MSLVSALFARLTELPSILAARLRTIDYRSSLEFASTARALGNGRILNPGGRREAVRVGMRTVLRGELFVFPHSGCIHIGDWGFLGENSRIWSSSQVVIGDRVLISHDVNIHDTNGHPIDAGARFAQTKEILLRGHPVDITTIASKPIRIGDDVWIGFGAMIAKGVTIGDGAIIAAHSVVTHDVEAWTMVMGNPARMTRKLDPK